MADSKRGITVVAKLLGRRQIETEGKGIAGVYDSMGGAVKKADEDAGKSGKGWELFSSKAKKAAKETHDSSHSMLKSVIGTAAGFAGGYIGVSAIKGMVSGTEEMASAAEKLHSMTGMSEGSALDYSAAFKARDVSAQAGANAYKFLAKNIQTAERQEYTYGIGQQKAAEKGKAFTTLLGTQATAFKRLGINVSTFGKLTGEQQFQTVVEKFEGMTNGAEKTRLATQLLGRGAQELLPILEKGSLGFKHQEEEAKKFFPTLKGGTDTLKEMREKQAESNMAWEGLEFTLGVKVIPIVTEVEGKFAKLITEIKEGKGTWGEIGSAVEKFIGILKGGVEWLTSTKAGVVTLKGALGGLAAVWGVEKIVSFYKALKSLFIVESLAKGFKALAGAEAEAGGAGAAASGGGLAGMLGKLGMLGKAGLYGLAAYGGLKGGEALAHVLGIEGKTNELLGGNQPGEQYKEGEGSLRAKGWTKRPKKYGWGTMYHPGGLAIVGDRGPELLSLPAGARVDPMLTHNTTPGMQAPGHWRGSSGDLIVSVQIDRKEIGRAVINEVNSEEARLG